MQEFESQFQTDELKQQVIKAAQEVSECWPEIVAMWSGMVKHCQSVGWTEYAARALVLSQVLRDSSFIAAAVPGAIQGEETEE